MIGRPYLWQCEAERCYRQRDRAGRWHSHGRDIGPDDPGAGNRYHAECRPHPTLGLDRCRDCGIPLGAVASHPNTGQCHPCWQRSVGIVPMA